MFVVNGKEYVRSDVEQRWEEYSQSSWAQSGGKVAVCLSDPAEVLSCLLFCKEQGISVLAIPSGTEEEAALRIAKNARCQGLLFENAQSFEVLDGAVGVNGSAGLLQMSSGTTGEPKVLERAWSSIDAEVASTLDLLSVNKGRVSVVACPVTHSYGFISGVLVGIARGSRVEIVSNGNPKAVLKCLMKHPKHILYASPVYLEILCQFAPKSLSLDAVMTSGVSMSQRSFERVKSSFSSLYQQYGCSEAGCISISQQVDKPNAIGEALAHLEVSAGSSNESAEEIVVVNELGKTVKTGDLGYFENGQLYYVSRIDDMINCAGLNVYPADVETVLLEHPLIDDAVVFGVDDPVAGQKVAAHWVGDESLNEYGLREWLKDKLMQHQFPQMLDRVKSIERAANGKVNRRKMSAQTV
ncbi:AMP-binding protein [Rubritalea spongiae]|uniref:AMP-binding protein n=1 Tax=Rubritalea spongiae TaxID=430797 RepID=A0ABW5E2X4_9BACT